MEIKDNYTNKCYNPEWVSAIREAQTNHWRWTFVSANDRTPILLNGLCLHSSIHWFIQKTLTTQLSDKKKRHSEKQKRQRRGPSEILLLLEEIALSNYTIRQIINILIIIIIDIYSVLTTHQWIKCLTCIISLILRSTWWYRKALNWSRSCCSWLQTVWMRIPTISRLLRNLGQVNSTLCFSFLICKMGLIPDSDKFQMPLKVSHILISVPLGKMYLRLY